MQLPKVTLQDYSGIYTMRNLFVNKERADINTLSGTEFQVSEKLFFKHQRPHVIICSGNI